MSKHRELLDEVALGYYAIPIIEQTDEYWTVVADMVREARAEWQAHCEAERASVAAS